LEVTNVSRPIYAAIVIVVSGVVSGMGFLAARSPAPTLGRIRSTP
jgi:hypothetical protein